jgi:hypothetical protein
MRTTCLSNGTSSVVRGACCRSGPAVYRVRRLRLLRNCWPGALWRRDFFQETDAGGSGARGGFDRYRWLPVLGQNSEQLPAGGTQRQCAPAVRQRDPPAVRHRPAENAIEPPVEVPTDRESRRFAPKAATRSMRGGRLGANAPASGRGHARIVGLRSWRVCLLISQHNTRPSPASTRPASQTNRRADRPARPRCRSRALAPVPPRGSRGL